MAEGLTGTKYGRWTVLAEAPRQASSPHSRRVLVLCECGAEADRRLAHLVSGASSSCGCADRERKTTHGQARKRLRTPEHDAWVAMKQRCENPNNPRWKDYGGRGIRVCPAWRESFQAFFADMGSRPSPAHSIDRKENDGNYEPDNCRWATTAEQAANKRPASRTT